MSVEDECARIVSPWDTPKTIMQPDGETIGQFKPCVIQHDKLRCTEIVLVDDMIVWRPWGPPGHCVDLGYDNSGTLVGIRVWDRVAKATT